MRRFVLLAALAATPMLAQAYSFDITNNASQTIVAIEVSEDGDDWGAFSGQTIKPGQTVTATWDESTDDSNCEWQLRAKYADGSESEPAAFDFCEKDLEVEFSD